MVCILYVSGHTEQISNTLTARPALSGTRAAKITEIPT